MIVLEKVRHMYGDTTVLDVDHLTIDAGSQCLVVGLSGSGKTTLLHVTAGLLRPSEGRVQVAGQELSTMPESQIDRFRGRNVGIVFQQLHLLPTLTVEENLLMAPYMAGMEQHRERVREVLEDLDMLEKARSYPSELSHGQKQRVAIARAVMNRPNLLLVDEPTSNLDDVRAEQVITLLKRQAEEYGATLVLATHDRRILDQFDQQYRIVDGRIARLSRVSSAPASVSN